MEKIKYENLKENNSFAALDGNHNQDVTTADVTAAESGLQQETDIFLLNNLLMSVQFFENYERDVEKLRKNWFKEISLESFHKKCFYADSLFRLSRENVKYCPRHGGNKNSESCLHPLRIYVSYDNVEAAYNPTALGQKQNILPRYQFTVRTTEKNEKSGCVQLVECDFQRTADRSSKIKSESFDFLPSSDGENEQESNFRRKSENFIKNTRRLTKTEKFVISQNKELSSKMAEKRISIRYFMDATDKIIPSDAFYKYTDSEAQIKPTPIHDFRMYSVTENPREIPPACFQRQEIKETLQGTRRNYVMKNRATPLFRSQNVLNASAFKGYFCDLFLEGLFQALALDSSAVSSSYVLEEFIIFNQSGTQYGVAPLIRIRDWNNFVVINKKSGETKHNSKKLEWPSSYMRKILNVLPCHVVPSSHTRISTKNPEYEKEWKLVFPKGEEFLLLHMMHSHVRCYFFALLVYKNFIETEINVASFGPKHLLHLLFWRIQKNFLAWPEDRPGETFLIYLKALYKKLQNKCLSDFFIPTRNLFATSHPKDLHKAQSLVKRILENPVLAVIRALRNLRLNPDFYPTLDTLKLYTILTRKNERTEKKDRKKKKKVVHFDENEDVELRWKKDVIKQIELEKKTEEIENGPKLSVESINIDENINLNGEKWSEVLEMFLSHFLKMSSKSMEFEFSSQALFYLSQAQKLFDLKVENGGNNKKLIAIHEQINNLKGKTFLGKHSPKESTSGTHAQSENNWESNTDDFIHKEKNTEIHSENLQSPRELKIDSRVEENETEIKIKIIKRAEDAIDNENNDLNDENELCETKL